MGSTAGPRPGLAEIPLHDFGTERVRLLRSSEAVDLGEMTWSGGAEFFVLEGELTDQEGRWPARAWLRLPPGATQRLAVSAGSAFYLKTGHLPATAAQESESM